MLIHIPTNKFNVVSINSIFQRSYKEDREFSGEVHDFWEMVYIDKGKLTVSEDEKVYELSKGQAIFHAPMEFHKFIAKKSEPCDFKIISFSLDTNLTHILSKGVFTLSQEHIRMLENTFTQISSGYDITGGVIRNSGNNPLEEILAIKMLEAFLLTLLSEGSPDRTQQLSVTAHRYKEVIKFMNVSVFENLSLKDISNRTHLSESYLKKLFKTYAGCGIMNYFTKMKITQSIYYLKEGRSIKEISEMLSFSSPNYFSAVFKKEMGMLPTKYRTKQ
jgi:AraC-like DNA-binding protein